MRQMTDSNHKRGAVAKVSYFELLNFDSLLGTFSASEFPFLCKNMFLKCGYW